jgi:hypothetical protein
LNVTNSDTSLAMISASTRMAVLICAARPKPDSIRLGLIVPPD